MEYSRGIVGLYLEVRTDFVLGRGNGTWFQPAEPVPDLVVVPYELLGSDTFVPPPVPFLCHGPAEGLRLAFVLGALDYLREPWTMDEFFLRLERLLPPVRTFMLPQGLLKYRANESLVQFAGSSAKLSPAESEVMELLTREPGVMVKRTEIMESIGKSLDREGSRVTDVIVSRLRKKLLVLMGKPQGFNPIVSCRNEGYLLPTYWPYGKLSP